LFLVIGDDTPNDSYTITDESTFNGSHIILTCDMRRDNTTVLQVPNQLISRLKNLKMKFAKIQFGIHVEFKKETGERKKWMVSNKALTYSDVFIQSGTEQLNALIERYAEGSSGWTITKILEIFMIINKYQQIMNLTGDFKFN
jgi:hypothetical protein